MQSVTAEVLQRVEKQTGVSKERITPSTRLLHDLDIEGDDAVEFFTAVEERFGTDLTALRERWSDHFGPEGFPFSAGLGLVLFVTPWIVVALFLGISGAWAMAIGLALLFLWLWGKKRWGPEDPRLPVTVADVVAAVEIGGWPPAIADYPAVAPNKT